MKHVKIACPYCGSKALLRPAKAVRSGAESDEKVYVCARYPVCDAYVAAHRENGLPMGTLADRPLRRKRQEAHRALSRFWECGYMSRKEAYRWLQIQLGLPEAETHIGHFSEYRCEQVIRLCGHFLGAQPQAA